MLSFYKDQFIKKIKNLTEKNNENLNILYDDYYEYSSEFYPCSSYYSSVFNISNSRWQATINPRKFAIYNIHIPKDIKYILARFTLSIHNRDDPSQYKIFQPSSLCYFKNKFSNFHDNYDGNNGYYEINFPNKYFEKYIQPLLINNEAIIGIYICVYEEKNVIEKYLSGIKNSISKNSYPYEIEGEEYFEEYFEDWNGFINSTENCTKYININGIEWTIQLLKSPKNKFLNLQIYNNKKLEKESKLFYNFVLFFRNGNSFTYIKKIVPVTLLFFNEDNNIFYSKKVIKISDLLEKNEHNKSIIENNKTVFGFYLCVYKNDENDHSIPKVIPTILPSNLKSLTKSSGSSTNNTNLNNILKELKEDMSNVKKLNSNEISGLIKMLEKDSSYLSESINMIIFLKMLEEEKRNKEEKIKEFKKEKENLEKEMKNIEINSERKLKETQEGYENEIKNIKENTEKEINELKEEYEKEKKEQQNKLNDQEKEIEELKNKLNEYKNIYKNYFDELNLNKGEQIQRIMKIA